MTHSVAVGLPNVVGNKRELDVTVTISSYTTGGEVITAAELGLIYIEQFEVIGASASGYVGSFVAPNKLFCWIGDNNNAADGPLVEAGSTNNVGAIKIKVIGR